MDGFKLGPLLSVTQPIQNHSVLGARPPLSLTSYLLPHQPKELAHFALLHLLKLELNAGDDTFLKKQREFVRVGGRLARR